MPNYRKKPVVIQAVQFTRDNWPELNNFIGDAFVSADLSSYSNDITVKIRTLEGVMTATGGDYIIRGVKGEIYSCRADIFEETYEEVI